MAKNRVTRKQLLKEPDEFLTTTARIIDWSREHFKPLIIGTVIFFGLLLGISLYTYFQKQRNNTAEAMLGQALTRYQTQVESKKPSEALTEVRGDFEKLINSYGGVPAGRLGELLFADISLAGGAYDDAITYYKQALAHFGPESALGNIILNGLGTAYQQKGDYSQAVAQFQKIADGASLVLKDAALFNLGHLYKQLGQAEQSRKAYQELEAGFPESMYAPMVKGDIAES